MQSLILLIDSAICLSSRLWISHSSELKSSQKESSERVAAIDVSICDKIFQLPLIVSVSSFEIVLILASRLF